jgi:hypothetical protein
MSSSHEAPGLGHQNAVVFIRIIQFRTGRPITVVPPESTCLRCPRRRQLQQLSSPDQPLQSPMGTMLQPRARFAVHSIHDVFDVCRKRTHAEGPGDRSRLAPDLRACVRPPPRSRRPHHCRVTSPTAAAVVALAAAQSCRSES